MVVVATAALAVAYCFGSGAFVDEKRGKEENATPKAVREKTYNVYWRKKMGLIRVFPISS